MVENKQVIYYGEVRGTSIVSADGSKLRGDEGTGPVLSGGYFEGARDGNLEYGNEEI